MNQHRILLFSFLFIAEMSLGNNIQLSNVSIVNNGPGNIQVQFDVSWDNSWRYDIGPANYDGAWVFFKYRTPNGNWTQLVLTGSNNQAPSGFDIYQTSVYYKTGAMIYRSASNMGKGSVNAQAVKLGAIGTLPYNIDLQGLAIEMVYVPSVGYNAPDRIFFGDGNGTSESLNAFHYTDNTATTSAVLPMLADANADDDGKLTADGIYVYSIDTIQTTNPIGSLDPFPTMKALWCMKYEISQAGYRDFLNTLTFTQQSYRTANSPASAQGTSALVPSGALNRNYIEIKTPSTSGVPAVYGCDANNNNTFDEAGDGEWIACNYLLWQDVAAYLDWSGLAPMSEFQYERICRGHSSAGPNPAVYGEFAWGTNQIYSSVYTLTTPSTTSEAISNSTGKNGNATWANTALGSPNNGPLRNGIFATATSDRISSGASFFGVMEMTGNVSEYCITVGTVAGRSVKYVPNGDGNLSVYGNAQLTQYGPGFWPGMEGNNSSNTINSCSGTCEVTGVAGIMQRGGDWSSTTLNTFSISARSSALPSSYIRTLVSGGGGRGVLYIR